MVRILFNLFNKVYPVTAIISGTQLNERKRKGKKEREKGRKYHGIKIWFKS